MLFIRLINFNTCVIWWLCDGQFKKMIYFRFCQKTFQYFNHHTHGCNNLMKNSLVNISETMYVGWYGVRAAIPTLKFEFHKVCVKIVERSASQYGIQDRFFSSFCSRLTEPLASNTSLSRIQAALIWAIYTLLFFLANTKSIPISFPVSSLLIYNHYLKTVFKKILNWKVLD